MPNILFAEMRQETASFNPFPTDYAMFRQMHGSQMTKKYQGTKTEISGFMDVMAGKEDIQLIPAMSAASVSGGWRDLKDQRVSCPVSIPCGGLH